VSPSTSTSTSNVGSVGQLPVGATSTQFTNMLQSLNHAVSAQSAVSSSSAASSAANTSNVAGATATAAGQNQGGLISSSQSSNTALQNILSNLLKDLKTSGVGSLNAVGNNVNTKV
jgi:hypothetical protein